MSSDSGWGYADTGWGITADPGWNRPAGDIGWGFAPERDIQGDTGWV
ncbi:hypothetical protein ACFWG5_34375 [Streptomyces hydrogenans]